MAHKRMQDNMKQKHHHAAVLQRFIKGKLARDRVQVLLMNHRLNQMQAQVEHLKEAQQGRALVPIVFLMKRHAKNMRQARMKLNAIRKLFLRVYFKKFRRFAMK